MGNLKQKVKNSIQSKFLTYKDMNPDLSVHGVYSKALSSYMPENVRMCFSRLRLSSHRLRIETGRWSRLPREHRLCSCMMGVIQDEAHVLEFCPLVQDIRDNYNIPCKFPECIIRAKTRDDFKMIHEIMQYFEN